MANSESAARKPTKVLHSQISKFSEQIDGMRSAGYRLHSWNFYVIYSDGRVQTSDYAILAVYEAEEVR